MKGYYVLPHAKDTDKIRSCVREQKEVDAHRLFFLHRIDASHDLLFATNFGIAYDDVYRLFWYGTVRASVWMTSTV
jgi:hypothetical protein